MTNDNRAAKPQTQGAKPTPQQGRPRPAHELRLGRVKAAVWANEAEGGVRYSVSVCRIYKEGEQWKTTESFGRDDLLTLAKVIDRAHSWIFDQQRGEEIPF